MEIRIRPASEADLPAVNRLRAQVNEVHVQGRPDIFKPGFGQEIRDHLAQRFADGDLNEESSSMMRPSNFHRLP